MRYTIDPDLIASNDGTALLGGDPVRAMRLSATGAELVRRWRDVPEFESTGLVPAERALLDRLVDASIAHPVPDMNPSGAALADHAGLDRLAVIVPVRNRPDGLDACLAALAGSGVQSVLVVDDASSGATVDAHRAIAATHGAQFIARPQRGGPAAARMTGWSSLVAADVVPDLVAFVDSDVVVDPNWWVALVDLLVGDPRLGLVAPRVVHPSTPALIDRYESAASPLDLGPEPGPIVAGTRVSYVPAAAMVVRAQAFAAVGGFDAALEVGEDVDLVWRLADAGWRCRYEPRSTVAHAGRDRWRQLLGRRADYGSSAALLHTRHRGAVAPVAGAPASYAAIGAVLAGGAIGAPGVGTVAGAAVAARSWWQLRSRLRPLGIDNITTTRLIAVGHLGLVRQLARATVRPWWPVTALVVCLAPRARRPLVVAAVASSLERWVATNHRGGRTAATSARSMDPWRWVALSCADDVAYSWGVWRGCVRNRSFGALLPRWQRAERSR